MVRFVFLADMQLGAYASFSGLDQDDVDRYSTEKGMTVEAVPTVEGFEWDANRYREAVAMVNAMRPELVIVGGDMVDDPNSEDQYDEFMGITHGIDSAIPVKWVPGNHDIAADTLVPTPESIAAYRAAFGADYHTFELGSVQFIALNTVVIDHPEGAPGEWEIQFGFLSDALAEADARGRTPVLVGHHPLFTHHAEEPDSYWNLPTERRRDILDLLHQYRVPLGLAGHWHRNAVAADGAFEMVTTGAVGVPLGPDPSGFRVVEMADGLVTHRYLPLEG
jgi:3',5'-cyclic AMP phosphodiesterase CpdA